MWLLRTTGCSHSPCRNAAHLVAERTDPAAFSESWATVKAADGILVPGGFGDRGVEGKIAAISHARTSKVRLLHEHARGALGVLLTCKPTHCLLSVHHLRFVFVLVTALSPLLQTPFLGICLGMQCSVIEYARNVLGWKDANSAEFAPSAAHKVVRLPLHLRAVQAHRRSRLLLLWGLDDAACAPASIMLQVMFMPEISTSHMGGTMRLGSRPTLLRGRPDGVISLAHDVYGRDVKRELRRRHVSLPCAADE